jgi:predicted XRE-type DNA-binding protein
VKRSGSTTSLLTGNTIAFASGKACWKITSVAWSVIQPQIGGIMQHKLNAASNHEANIQLHQQGLSQHKIAMVLGISKTRVAQVLGKII